jgi:hypothetical protein
MYLQANKYQLADVIELINRLFDLKKCCTPASPVPTYLNGVIISNNHYTVCVKFLERNMVLLTFATICSLERWISLLLPNYCIA